MKLPAQISESLAVFLQSHADRLGVNARVGRVPRRAALTELHLYNLLCLLQSAEAHKLDEDEQLMLLDIALHSLARPRRQTFSCTPAAAAEFPPSQKPNRPRRGAGGGKE
jgi:hypothetical protein